MSAKVLQVFRAKGYDAAAETEDNSFLFSLVFHRRAMFQPCILLLRLIASDASKLKGASREVPLSSHLMGAGSL